MAEQVGEFVYNKKDLIGHGAFAVVFKGHHKKVKTIPYHFLGTESKITFVQICMRYKLTYTDKKPSATILFLRNRLRLT